jgi:hypothetical protein
MLRRPGLLLTVSLLLISTPLVGCGYNATNGKAVPPTVTTASSSPASTGPVTVGTDTPIYRTGDAIAVTLSNQSLQTILFPDHQSSCTVVLLQRQVNESWESINLCKLMIVTMMHSLDAGYRLKVKLVALPNQWMPGLYRVKLSYSNSLQSNHLVIIFSAVFQVQSA